MMPAFFEASIASSPRVGPTTCWEMISTGSGSAPPLIRRASSVAESALTNVSVPETMPATQT